MTRQTGIIILAAGGSSRMGQPKQLMHFGGRSLVRGVVDAGMADERHVVAVVLGAHADEVARELSGTGVLLVTNTGWEAGMASSIRAGLASLLEFLPGMDACILTVCDQPYIQAAVFEGLQSTQLATGKGIVVSGYDDTYGTPVLFTRPYFNQLLQLEGQEGAKKVIRQHESDAAVYPFEAGRTDIDTMEGYLQLTR